LSTRWSAFWKRISLIQQFLLAALVILLISAILLGWWVARQIEIGALHRVSIETSLYVDSFVDPPLQELAAGKTLTPEHIEMLNRLVRETPLGQHIVAFKIWDTHGRTIYSTNPDQIGKTFPINDELGKALAGEVVTDISNLTDAEDVEERAKWSRLLETYSPITRDGTTDVIGVVGFYQTLDTLDSEIHRAQLSSLGFLGGMTLVVFLLLSIFVQRASNTIEHQRSLLSDQVTQLTTLLTQNAELNERIRRAASQAAMFNERSLRRIRAELHDGPVQELSYALLRLDSIQSPKFLPPETIADGHPFRQEMQSIETSLQQAILEIRATSTGMGLPDLDQVSPIKTLELVVQAHEQRTGTRVKLDYKNMPDQACLVSKITLYRFVQEALNNSYRHAGGQGQEVVAYARDGMLNIEIRDLGPGFDINQKFDQSLHLGLSGMRERVESLGGLFSIESAAGQGTHITASIPLQAEDLSDEL